MERIYINDGWGFTENYSDELLRSDYDAAGLVSVRLPHTCKETPFNYFDEGIYQMVCGYRKIIKAPREWQGNRIFLTIDGAAHESEVYLNGEKITEHHCGYTAFTVEISQFLIYGADNSLVVKVNSREDINVPPFGFVIDYMTYGGIYRDVYIDVKNESYISDIYIRSEFCEFALQNNVAGDMAKEAKLISDIVIDGGQAEYVVRQLIKEHGQEKYSLLGEKNIANKGISEYRLNGVKLWDTDKPFLYDIRTELLLNDEVIDVKERAFGFRRAEFKKDGFYLNYKKFKIRGLNRHQSYPYVGYAMPKSMQVMDANILKEELGLNAVRTSHYPQSHYFLDRCDELGLLVFTEMPGWQHIGDEEWKQQAIENVKDMIMQYRNHTSIILWGVRINESQDDDEFYRRTNAAAHELDPYRQTGGVRANKKSSLLEDVYTYNDFVHCGDNKGCEPKRAVTSNKNKPYLISEYNGHMFPTKSYDCEDRRTEHALRHAKVLDSVAANEDIAGSFGWCMTDYNTHKDFGSGDRICYHGVMDMFRNPKMAADIYTCQQEQEVVLSLSTSMDIGEHPGCNRGNSYIFTNADSVKMYKNGRFIKEYKPEESPYRNIKCGPILIDDYVGDVLVTQEGFGKKQAELIKQVLNSVARYGLGKMPLPVMLTAARLLTVYRMNMAQAVDLYTRYVGDWGGASTSYSFEAIKDGKVVKQIVKEPMKQLHLSAQADHTVLKEENSYDVAAIRIKALDENDNLLSFFSEPLSIACEGPIELIGPSVISLKGGMGGTYIKTTGETGNARVILRTPQAKDVVVELEVM